MRSRPGVDPTPGTRDGLDPAAPVVRLQRAPEALGYVPELDGLRAIAVLAVCVYHARMPWLTGGFLGVSTFFTLSGFLITSLLLRTWWTTADIDPRAFWTRRFRRLLPAAWVTLAAIVALGAVGVWNDAQLRSLRLDVAYALLDVINWHFITSGRSYGADFAAPSPLEHFWSLAIEQQFYLALPVLFVAVLGTGGVASRRSRLRALVAVLIALSVASVALSSFWARTSIDRAYFGTDSRLAELTVGALLACATLRRLRLPAGVARTASLWVGVGAAVVSVWLWHSATTSAAWMYPWGFLLSASCTTAVVYAAVQGAGPLARVFAVAPLVALGRISYGVYLIHWPVFLILSPARVGWSPWPLFVLRMGVTVVAATALHRFVEQPVRLGVVVRPGRFLATAVVVAIALVGATLWVTRSLPPATELGFDRSAAAAAPAAPPPLRAVLVGDQVAEATAAVIDGGPGLQLTAAGQPHCGLGLGGWVTVADGTVERDAERCVAAHDAWSATVDASRPDVVIAMPGLRDVADRRLTTDRPWSAPGDPFVDDFLTSQFEAKVDALGSSGASVVLMTMPYVRNAVAPSPQPMWSDPALAGTAEAVLEGGLHDHIRAGAPGPHFAENDDDRVDAVNAALRTAAQRRGVAVLDLAAHLAERPGRGLDPSDRPDGVVISDALGEQLGPWMDSELRRPRPTPPVPVASSDPMAPLPVGPPQRARRIAATDRSVRVMVVGDSVATGLSFGLHDWATATDADLEVLDESQAGCSIARSESYRFQHEVTYFFDECDWSMSFPAAVADRRPDVVLISSGIWEVADRRDAGADRFTHLGEPGADHHLLSEFLAAIDTLGTDGATVVLLTQPEMRPGIEQGFQDLPESDPRRIARLNELLAEAAALRPDVATVMDLQEWLRHQGGGQHDSTNRPDGVHFTTEFSMTIGGWIGPQLIDIARGRPIDG